MRFGFATVRPSVEKRPRRSTLKCAAASLLCYKHLVASRVVRRKSACANLNLTLHFYAPIIAVLMNKRCGGIAGRIHVAEKNGKRLARPKMLVANVSSAKAIAGQRFRDAECMRNLQAHKWLHLCAALKFNLFKTKKTHLEIVA